MDPPASRGRPALRLTATRLLPPILVLSALPLSPGRGQSRPGADLAPPSHYVHEVWTVEDGLPVNSINDLLQSRDGYLWAATFDGLVRFDGARFTVYNTSTAEGLPSSRILNLLEAKDGSLWMRTQQSHLVRFLGGSFTHFALGRGLRDNTTRVIHESPDGTVWVGTDNGVGFIEGDRFVPAARQAIRVPVGALASDSAGNLWVGTRRSGLYRVNGEEVVGVVADGPVGRRDILTLSVDPTGVLWVGTDAGAYRYENGGIEAVTAEDLLARLPVWQILVSPRAGSLWMTTDRGVYRVEGTRATLVTDTLVSAIRPRQMRVDSAGHVWAGFGTALYRDGRMVYRLGSPSPGDPFPLTEIRGFLHDHEGSIWIGTNAGGLHRLKRSFFTVYSEAEGLAHRNVYSVLEDRSGAVWIGTWGRGLSRIVDGTVTNFPPERDLPWFVLSLLEDRIGKLWVAGYNAGVKVCALPRMTCDEPAPAPLREASVFAMYEDDEGKIWLGSDQGLFRYDAAGWVGLSVGAGAPSTPVRVFHPTRDGALWMGTNGGGLARYGDGRFTRVTTAEGLPSDLIRSLYQDADGWLWVGTEGHGLVRLNPAAWGAAGAGSPPGSRDGATAADPATIVVYRARDGLFDEVIHQILEDDDGRLWMSSNRGIFWVRRDELLAFAAGDVPRIRSTAYTERDGLRNREANGGAQPAGMKARDGRLWFPTQDGVVVVDPADVQRNQVPPRVVIERIVLPSRTLRPVSGGMALAADERDLQIEYTAMSFIAPENVRFRYRLEGFDDGWIEAGNRRTAFYTKVPPGRYTFRVVASNDAGVWNEQGAAVLLRVAPYFYESTVFHVFLIIAAGGAGLALVRLRERRLRTRERELTRLVEARTEQLRRHEAQLEEQNAQLEAQAAKLAELDHAKSRFFANISHEFRTPLTLTIGPLEDLQRRMGASAPEHVARELDLALRNARRLLRLVNQLLDLAKLEAGRMQIRARRRDLVDLLRGLLLGFGPLAERKGVTARLDGPDPGLLYFDPDLLEKVFTNLLSNAFKFTPQGGAVRVTIRDIVSPDGRRVEVSVRDSGPGIPEDDLPHVFDRFYQVAESGRRFGTGTGIGLALAKELVELHGGEIRVDSEEGFGSTFTVVLRQGQAHFAPDQLVEMEDAADPEPPLAAVMDAADGQGEWWGGAPGGAIDAAAVAGDVTTVLVVDDSSELRAYVRQHLSPPYRVVEARDGAEGLEAVRRWLPDLVVSDIMMPGVDGQALCRTLKEDPDFDYIPVILLTAKAGTADKLQGLADGADDYLIKPFDVEELKARIGNLIAVRQRLRDRYGHRAVVHAGGVDVVSSDDAFLERVREEVEAHMGDEDFGVEGLARAVGQSRSNLYRRLHDLVGESPADLIKRVRLERAEQLLRGGAGTVSEVAYGVGFKSVSHFSRIYREHFGLTPSAHRRRGGRDSSAHQ